MPIIKILPGAVLPTSFIPFDPVNTSLLKDQTTHIINSNLQQIHPQLFAQGEGNIYFHLPLHSKQVSITEGACQTKLTLVLMQHDDMMSFS